MTKNNRVLGCPGNELMLYRMVPVIGTLRCKPLMQCHDKCRGLCAIPDLRPIWEGSVLYIDVLGARLQCDQPWHVLPVNFRWIQKITPVELLSLLRQVCRETAGQSARCWIGLSNVTI